MTGTEKPLVPDQPFSRFPIFEICFGFRYSDFEFFP